MSENTSTYVNRLPSGMLYRVRNANGKLSAYKLRFRIRRRRECSPEVKVRGLATHKYNEAYLRAVLVLRSYADDGMLAGWNGQEFIDLSLRRRRCKIGTQKKGCHTSENDLQQMQFDLS